jgi:hypothetical protein
MTSNHYQWTERADGAASRWTRRRRAEPEDGSYRPGYPPWMQCLQRTRMIRA